MIEVVDHVGELELRITAATPAGVIDEALAALASEVAERLPSDPRERHPVALRAPGRDQLLVDLLNEAIYLLDTRAFVAVRLDAAELSEGVVRGELVGFRDPDARPIAKAATHHRLTFGPSAEGWRAVVVIDV